ncbi:hypothetical protein AB1286_17625 [Trinickia sp. NRRL B-1857]|uniref:hypothetical protein n=1 Tax=Trinickia sp. NRRL B-1857 TaxID=3162879 RepID=UPI003D2BF7D4
MKARIGPTTRSFLLKGWRVVRLPAFDRMARKSKRRKNATPRRNAVFGMEFSVISRTAVSGTSEIQTKNN